MPSFPINVGLVGCGNISGIYLQNARRFVETRVVACADLAPERARGKADEFGVDRAASFDELLADPAIEIVLNLTVPRVHAEITLAALRAGKSVYSEKPLALTRDDGRRLLETAAAARVRVGCAPDTFLGAGLQTARQALDRGDIGRPVAATAFMVCHGHETWHPDPAFFYQRGGGPMFDMGPYYVTALVHLLGPVQRVCGMTRISFPERVISSAPKRGQRVPVEIPTHIAGVLEFASGAIATLVTSFDIWHANVPLVEIYGSDGSLSVPDPNGFGGPVRIRRAADKEWAEVPLLPNYRENSRGVGVADLARALRTGRAPRASGELALHVLDVMQSLHESADQGRHVALTTTCERPAPLPPALPAGVLDD